MRSLPTIMAALLIGGCSSLGGAGPSGSDIRASDAASQSLPNIAVIDIDANRLARLAALRSADSFAQTFGDMPAGAAVIGRGDVIDISIWEAPPAVLFGAGSMAGGGNGGGNGGRGDNPMVARNGTIPQQAVGEDGTVTVPFVGAVAVAGRDTQAVERAILDGLRGPRTRPAGDRAAGSKRCPRRHHSGRSGQ